MNVAQLIELLDRLAERSKLGLGLCEERLRSELTGWPIPEGLAYLLTSHWPQTPELARINCYGILTTAQILSTLNTESLVPNQLLAIGDSGCGDTLVLDFHDSPPSIAVLNHETYDYESDPRAHTAPVSPSLKHFLQSAVNERFVPGDYYEALDASKD